MNARLAIVVNLVLASAAYADEATEPPLDVFLEQRVAEELAVDGVLLSRLGVTLDIQIVADTVIVSVIDSSTRRAVASTKVDRVAGDREAAVAQVTQVASSLVDQISHAPAVTSVTDDVDKRAAFEDRFRQEEITFASANGDSWGQPGNNQAPYRGALREPLDEMQFFTEVGRPELGESQRQRYRGGAALVVVGAVFFTAGASFWITDKISDDPEKPAWIGNDKLWVPCGLGGLAVMIVGGYYVRNALPIEQRELYGLAKEHNRQLRVKYGLPVTVAPFADSHGAGIAMTRGF